MALILHIADLHLVAASQSATLADHKTSLVPRGSRVKHHDALTLTLQRLGEYLINNGRHLEAIVFTGDIADRNNDGGYEAFEQLIRALGHAKPPNNRIMVLPGNHDVSTGLKPGDPARYEKFVRFIRAAGYVTPWFSGLDVPPTSAAEAEKYILNLDDVQIIPLDTSEFSQVRIDVGISDESWAKLEDVLAESPDELKHLGRLRSVDAARVSEKQLEAVRKIIQLATIPGHTPLRVAAMHHHLLPVSLREEIKPFESLTNLGLVRQFLMEQEVAIVLHGHKHTSSSYVDFVSPLAAVEERPCPIRVVSGAAATATDLDSEDVFRLLEVQPNTSLLELTSIGTVISGLDFVLGKPQPLSFSRPRGAKVTGGACLVVEGDTVSDVYPTLLAAVVSRGATIEHVTCQVRSSPKLDALASLYPLKFPTTGAMAGETAPGLAAAKQLEQFSDIVKWWQYPSLPEGPLDQPAFTHGARIKRYAGHLNQVSTVVNALSNDLQTSRGIIVLLEPPADRIDQKDVPFPSFCLVHFMVGRDADGLPSLDCTAYFRKQEVRFWWLVNLAELSTLQREICDALSSSKAAHDIRKIKPGSVTTVATRVHAGQSPPKVQVPQIDRFYGLERERLVNMVNSLVWRQMPNRAKHADEWLRLFTELQPPESPDQDGFAVSLAGISYIIHEIERHLESQLPERAWLQELAECLRALHSHNQYFALLQQKEVVSSEKYGPWRETVLRLIAKIIELSYGRVDPRE